MKKISGPVALIAFSLLVSFVFGVACTKDDDNDTPARDTVNVCSDTALNATILTSKRWMFNETRGIVGSNWLYYKRGATSGNTQSFDNEYLTFNSNGTGVLTEHLGNTHNFNWAFTAADNSKMSITMLNTPATFTLIWEQVRYKNGSFYYNEYYVDGNLGVKVHTSVQRMPKP